MNPVKQFNLDLFHIINSNFGKPFLTPLFDLLNMIGEPQNFIYHFLGFASIAFILVLRKLNNRTELVKLMQSGVACSLTAFLSLLIGFAFFTTLFKYYTEVVRPFCSIENIHVISTAVAQSKCFTSFPSGHTSYCIIIVASFWPLFNNFFKTLSIIFLILLAISRVASGNHFPLDILGAIALCLPVTLYFRTHLLPWVLRFDEEKQYISRILAYIAK